MGTQLPSILQPILKKVQVDEGVLAVMLFGSQARDEGTLGSDIDLCLVLPPGRAAKPDQLKVREAYVPFQSNRVDIHLFQQLPLYIRRRVLKEGTVLFCRNEDAMYEVAYRTARAFEEFKPFYEAYLEQVARAGS